MLCMDIWYIYFISQEDSNMKVAVIGSRGWTLDYLSDYIPMDTTGIISGGARGIDACAREFADKNQIPLTEFLHDFKRYGRSAPLKRNILIIEHADLVLAFWDGESTGTKFVIDTCIKRKIPLQVYRLSEKPGCTPAFPQVLKAYDSFTRE